MVLLDTHTLLWFLGDSEYLSSRAMDALNGSRRFVSVVSLWEIAVKKSLVDPKRRLYIEMSIKDIADECVRQGIEILAISPDDCDRLEHLPHLHEDPFDRLLIAQAMERGLALITKDEKIWRYTGIKTIW